MTELKARQSVPLSNKDVMSRERRACEAHGCSRERQAPIYVRRAEREVHCYSLTNSFLTTYALKGNGGRGLQFLGQDTKNGRAVRWHKRVSAASID